MFNHVIKKKVTRNDVAERAGVSPSTVSYVINDGPRPVSKAARERVLNAIAELDYHPSDVARSLRTQRSKTLGLIIPNTTDPIFADVTHGVEEVTYQHDYTLILGHSNSSPERERRYAQVLRSKRVDGVIFYLVSPDTNPVRMLEDSDIRTIILERDLPGYHCFVADERLGGYLATRHLLELGHRRISYIARENDVAQSKLRADGYRQALTEYGLPVDETLVASSKFGYEAAQQTCRQLLDLPQRPTAIVCYDDITAIGALKAVVDAGLSVPGDVSLVGYDDTALAAYTLPALTTINYPKHQMGRAAAELLFRLLIGDETIPPSTVVLPVRLVVRGSTAPCPSK